MAEPLLPSNPEKENAKSSPRVTKLISGALKYWGGDAEAKKRYDEATTRERDLNKTAEEQHPYASLGGNVAGAIALPIGAAANAATLPGRIAAGAGVGAAFGGASGSGEGVGLSDSLNRAGTGAAVGGVVGGAAVPVIAGISAAGRGLQKAAEPITSAIRGSANPGAQAARNIALARQRDLQSGNPGLTESAADAARLQGNPIINADVGGETVRALGRSAANTSAEGRNALNEVISDRFATQQPRIAGWLKNEFDFPDSTAAIDRLHEAARRTNRPAYAKAYAEGQAIWDDGLEQLVQAPVVQQAIRITALLRGVMNFSGSSGIGVVYSPDSDAQVPNTPAGNGSLKWNGSGAFTYVNFDIDTNASAQIIAVSSSSGTLFQCTSYGFVDRRGRDS
jgi:hypothetical protein